MKKMTVTELNALTDYVVENVLNAKREDVKKSRSTISENELNELFRQAQELAKEKADAQKVLDEATEKLRAFNDGLREKNFEGRYVEVDAYYHPSAQIRNYTDEDLFYGTKYYPLSIRKDVERRLVLKNLGSEVDVEKFIQELVASY